MNGAHTWAVNVLGEVQKGRPNLFVAICERKSAVKVLYM